MRRLLGGMAALSKDFRLMTIPGGRVAVIDSHPSPVPPPLIQHRQVVVQRHEIREAVPAAQAVAAPELQASSVSWTLRGVPVLAMQRSRAS